jgi:5-methylthioadenosine/S-adenosylhomocysteine deaminase
MERRGARRDTCARLVLCAGQIKKWRGEVVGYDIPKLRTELDASRDYVFAAAGIERDLFRA